MTNRSGLVYILSNPSFRQGLVKIGMTTRTAEQRAWEIYVGSTGVLEQFVIAYSEVCSDCALAERLIHERLNKQRINQSREFFDLPLQSAIEAVQIEVGRINSTTKPSADLPPRESARIRQTESHTPTPTTAQRAELGAISTTPTARPNQTDPSQAATNEKPTLRPLPRATPWGAIVLFAFGGLNAFGAYNMIFRHENAGGAMIFGIFALICVWSGIEYAKGRL